LAAGRFSITELNPSNATAERRQAARLIADFGLQDLRPALVQLLSDPKTRGQTASEFARAIVALAPSSQATALAESLSIVGIDDEIRNELKRRLLADVPQAAKGLLGKAMMVATAVEQQRVAEQLASDRQGVETLVSLVELGQASRRLLTAPSISAKISSIATSEQKARVDDLTKNLPDENVELLKQMQQRKSSYLVRGGNPSSGAEVFRVQCGICHQVAGQGASVGPNLDGIGNRGIDRVIEDVMMPNRNIDAAFRASVVLTDDGQVISGLIKRSEGAQLVVVDPKGKEIQIPTESIVQKKSIGTSPMPANLYETLNDDKTRDLLAYLLSLTH
jgi:putative heme-binding domain-containing protein